MSFLVTGSVNKKTLWVACQALILSSRQKVIASSIQNVQKLALDHQKAHRALQGRLEVLRHHVNLFRATPPMIGQRK